MQAMIRAMETLKIPYKYEHNKVPKPFRVPRMEHARQCDLRIDLLTYLMVFYVSTVLIFCFYVSLDQFPFFRD